MDNHYKYDKYDEQFDECIVSSNKKGKNKKGKNKKDNKTLHSSKGTRAKVEIYEKPKKKYD